MPNLQEMNCKNIGIKSLMDNTLSSVNQAVKAIAMARGFMSVKGHDLYVAPGFSSTVIDNEEMTSLKLVLKLM